MRLGTALLAGTLLLLVGIASTHAQVSNFNVSTQNLGFGGTTTSPSPSQSYYIQWLGPNTGTVSINVYNSVPYIKVSRDNANFSTTLPDFQLTTGAWAFIYVRVEASAPMTLAGFGGNDCVSNHIVYFEPALNRTLSFYHFVWLNGNIPLPIQLASFKATMLNGEGVALTWTTASEINNFGFEAQRSFDGKTFVSIAGSFVPGNGTTNQCHTYSYVDANPAGSVSYRLKQIDRDGTIHYSEPIQTTTTTDVKELTPTVFGLQQNYPNPFNPSTRISFSVAEEGPISLRVYDVLGSEVALLVNENRQPGRYTEQFNGSRLASGVYMYVLRTSQGQMVGRMMLSK
jgi:hypothetical protein